MEQKITNEFIAAAFAAYLGAWVTYPNSRGGKPNIAKLTKSGFDEIETTYKRKKEGCVGDILSFKSNGWHNMDALHTQLLLTDLKYISEEHLNELAKIMGYDGVFTAKYSEECFSVDYGDGVSFIELQYLQYEAADYLRSKNYALKFRGVDLVTAGIAILTTKTTTNEK